MEKKVLSLGREAGSEVDTHHYSPESCHQKIRQAHNKPTAA